VRIRAAEPDDVEAIADIVERAYCVYIERIGLRPGPMDDDHGEQVRRGLVHVAEDGRRDAGEEDGAQIVGLLVFAEEAARGAGIGTVALYTHEKMTENLALRGSAR